MAETRKNHLAIDGAQVKDDEHIASYKPIPEAFEDHRSSKASLGKSKEKLSADGAEELLLQKEDQAKITTRVDMADAKYVVGDHRNGDAKIELDANKRQFSGLTKEELMKFADDPFWVRVRWCMFALFWLLWLAMLAGAIAIIVGAPKCAPPPPKNWAEKGPLFETAEPALKLTSQEILLKNLQTVKAQGLFVSEPDAYRVLDDEQALDGLKALVAKAKEYGINVIVELTASFVPSDHAWFQSALNKTGDFPAYFVWAKPKEYQEGTPVPPNNWVSTLNESAWKWSPEVGKFYYQLYGADKPQLNLTNPAVVRHFDEVLKKYMAVGVGGVRLQNARELLINESLADELARVGQGVDLSADLTQRAFWQQKHTSDQPALDPLFAHWAHVANSAGPALDGAFFSIGEDGSRPELYLLQRELGSLRPPSAAAVLLTRPAADVARDLNKRLQRWAAVELKQDGEPSLELAAFATLLPAAPVLRASLFAEEFASNDTSSPTASFAHLVALRTDASIEHGNSSITAVPARNTSDQLLVCARWKAGHTGYAAVWNPTSQAAHADLSAVHSVPASVTLHYVTPEVRAQTNYTNNQNLVSDDILVPALSTVVLSYVPATEIKS